METQQKYGYMRNTIVGAKTNSWALYEVRVNSSS
jgi:hypothetical protein